MSLLKWMEEFPTSEWITTSDWGFPIMLVFHSIGLAAVVGILVMLDFRVLGYARLAPLAAFDRLMSVAWIGFLVNLASGSLLFMADASRLVVNWPFLVKMSCVLLGGIVSAMLWRRLRADGVSASATAPQSAETFKTDSVSRALALVSIFLWVGAITFGRLIAYVMDHDLLHGDLK